MARPLRIDREDTFYHVLNRGNERRSIFRDAQDYAGFLSLAQYAHRLGIDAQQLAELSRPRRRRERPNRDALMYLLWRDGHIRQHCRYKI